MITTTSSCLRRLESRRNEANLVIMFPVPSFTAMITTTALLLLAGWRQEKISSGCGNYPVPYYHPHRQHHQHHPHQHQHQHHHQQYHHEHHQHQHHHH
eukprot:9404925-Pyramimonas_sp.AAC.1